MTPGQSPMTTTEHDASIDRSAKHRRFHVHFESSPRARPSQSFTRERFRAVEQSHPGVADGLDITFGNDPARFDEHLATCEVLMIAGPVDMSNLAVRAPKLKWVQA